MQYMITVLNIHSFALKGLEVWHANDLRALKKKSLDENTLESCWCSLFTKMTQYTTCNLPLSSVASLSSQLGRVILGLEPVVSEAGAYIKKNNKYFWDDNILESKHRTGIQNNQF